MSEPAGQMPDFDTQYRPLMKDVFAEIVAKAVREGADPVTEARTYAERGKPDFVLAYLIVSGLPDAEKREIFAHAHERRATHIEQRAQQFNSEFHRPFPLLRTEAAKDRIAARNVRAGRAIQPGAGKHIPLM